MNYESSVLVGMRRRVSAHKKQKVRAWIFIIGILLVSVLLALLFVVRSTSSLKPTSLEGASKVYLQVFVEPGDTVWSIAQERIDRDFYDIRSYVNEIISINHLEENGKLYAGTKILIPVIVRKGDVDS